MATGDHVYTISEGLRNLYLGDWVWIDEGVAGWVHAAAAAGTVPLLWMLKTADILVPIRIVRVADDDGTNQARIETDQVACWVEGANRAFALGRIGLTFDAARDFETLRGTRLNGIWADSGLEIDRLTGANPALFDNDRAWVDDTNPEPYIIQLDWSNDSWVTLSGRVFELLRWNIMSYARTLPGYAKGITGGQARRMKAILAERRAQGLEVAGLI